MLFEQIRNLLCPFDEIEKYVPQKGRILDVGCGHGTFARLLASESKQRTVLGIDPAENKIKLAKVQAKSKRVKFKTIDILKLNKDKFDCITIIDVLCLMPYKEKLKTLKKAKSLLNKNGVLILKEGDTSPKPLFWLVLLQETIAVKILKYTYSKTKKLYFTSSQEYKQILTKIGFSFQTKKRLWGKIPYVPHFLIVATLNHSQN